jgi:ORF6N domain.
MEVQIIQNKIYEIRGCKVMLDFDLAEMYQVETKRLNETVKRNIKRFPPDFMFKLTSIEYNFLRSQIATLENQIPPDGRGKYSKYLPTAFTQEGVSMLSGLLNSDVAIQVNIAIMRAFVAVRQLLLHAPVDKNVPAATRNERPQTIHRRSLLRPKRH